MESAWRKKKIDFLIGKITYDCIVSAYTKRNRVIGGIIIQGSWTSTMAQ